MLEALKKILDIQELDMQMIQLMRLKRQREMELNQINSSKESLRQQVHTKEQAILELKKNIRLAEGELNETNAKFKKLESQQHAIKKVDEFNALNQEMAQTEKERVSREQRLSEAYDKLAVEEDLLKALQQSLEETTESNKTIETEIHEAISTINKEGRELKQKRDEAVGHAEPDTFQIYERLLRNKKDRVIVPIENRCCSGCHIMLTAQDENLVRKGERLVFCEHCSRIHYWPESEALETTTVAVKPRRRRSSATKT
jgi:predicted  nucleic acid-binding Zn-ribbon protein